MSQDPCCSASNFKKSEFVADEEEQLGREKDEAAMDLFAFERQNIKGAFWNEKKIGNDQYKRNPHLHLKASGQPREEDGNG